MQCPFQRLRQEVGRTQVEFAKAAGLSRIAILTLEQGMYDVVPLKANLLLAALCKEQGVDARGILWKEYRADTLNQAMDRWKKDHRKLTDLSAWPLLTLPEIVARFKNPHDFCVKLCVPTAALHNVTTRNLAMPEVIITALAQAGYKYGAWLQ